MLSPLAMEDYQSKRRQSLPSKTLNSGGKDSGEKLERYRQLLLKEEEIRAKLERATRMDAVSGNEMPLPRVLMQKRLVADVIQSPKRKMSCPAIRIEIERNVAHASSSLRQPASPLIVRPNTSVPDIRVQPVSPLMQSSRYSIASRNSDLSPESAQAHRRKMSCPVALPMKKYASIEDLKSEISSPDMRNRRSSMQPSYAEIRAMEAKEKLQRRRQSLKSLEEDFLKVHNVMAMAKALSLSSLAESQTEETDEKEERLRKTSSCVL